MKEKKVYTLVKTRTFLYNRPDQVCNVEGTLDELTEYFSYTLSTGHEYDSKVNKNPKTIRSLIKSVNRGYEAMGMFCYVELAEKQD